MVGWSRMLLPAAQFAKNGAVVLTPSTRTALQQQLRRMADDHGHHHMSIRPSRFQWQKFKDLFHFYVMLGVIPITALVFYSNVFIGPSQLAEIPEDYVPEHWEYEKNPITRFISRNILTSHQQEYEKACHNIFEENEKALIRKLEAEIRLKMSERNDYQAYYYRPTVAKYHRISKEAADELEALRGD